MGRYLLFISYIGTGFRGIAKQTPELKTIAGTLEEVLKVLQPANEVEVVTSSRTDKGVHAICNTVHVDLQHREELLEYDPKVVTSALNSNLMKYTEDIRVLKTLRVNDDFHCRYQATGRQYMYRVCLSKRPELGWKLPYTPLEYKRSYFVRYPVDLDQMKQAAEMLSGTHDFKAFTVPQELRRNPWRDTVKTLEIKIQEGRGILEEHLTDYTDHFQHLELMFTGNSFLYKQVRQITSIILGVGRGVIDLHTVEQLLEKPLETRSKIVNTALFNITPSGLYLKKVIYHEEDLAYLPDRQPGSYVRKRYVDSKSQSGDTVDSHSDIVSDDTVTQDSNTVSKDNVTQNLDQTAKTLDDCCDSKSR